MIDFRDVTKLYGRTIGLHSFSMRVDEPGINCLLGRNGAGKTTLLKLLAGQLATTSGEVVANGKRVGLLAMPDETHFLSSESTQFNVKLQQLFRLACDVNPVKGKLI
jgi:ABC-2 type transport system ATP-binding protein